MCCQLYFFDSSNATRVPNLMLSNNLLYVFLIAALGLAALTVNYVITSREREREYRNTRLKWLKEQSEHTLNALSVLKEINCRGDIIDKLNQHALSLIEEIGVLAPDSELMTEVSKIKDTTDRTRPKQDPFNNDRAVRKAQIYINFAEKLIIDMANKGKMTAQLAHTYQQELYWLNVSMVADAHIIQGKALMQQGDKVAALTHLKHAKAMLVRAAVPQHQKRDRLLPLQGLIDQLQPKKDLGPGALAETLDAYLKEQP